MNSLNVFASQISLTCYFYLSFTKKKKKKFSAFIIKTKKKENSWPRVIVQNANSVN